MEHITNWAALWRELVEESARRRAAPIDTTPPAPGTGAPAEGASERAARRLAGRHWAKPSPARDFVIAQVRAAAGSTVLDIGAGTGAWAALLAPHAQRVTAVEPSAVMREQMQANLAEQGITNVEIVAAAWPAADVPVHDFALCSHGMYGEPDLAAFVRRAMDAARRACFLVLRAPDPQGVMADAAQHVWRQPNDSPNFQVAYNLLLDMGIVANVLIEDAPWKPWSHDTLDAALADTRRRLGLPAPSNHDGFLRDLLARRLIREGDRYVWPDAIRSALVYWRPGLAR